MKVIIILIGIIIGISLFIGLIAFLLNLCFIKKVFSEVTEVFKINKE